ncbi:hypothetical protein ABZP36_033466 [Zizania latifolia]
MKLGSKPDAFTRRGQAWFCTAGLPSDVLVEVGEMSFHLHKFPLLSKSAILGRLIEENSDIDECIIKLSDIPGAAKSFELVAWFCYGLKIELSSANVVYLRCAAEYLQMTEETAGDNLINQTETFFNQVVLRSWKDSLEALQTCDVLLPHAEDLHIVKRCIESLAGKASIDPDLFGWPVSENSAMQSPGGSVLWNGISTGAKFRNCSSDWWYDDASSLSFATYKKLISAMESRGIKKEIIAGSLTYYAKKFLPGLNRRQSTGPMPLTAATLSDEEQRHLLEEIDRMLPLQRGLISTNLRTSVAGCLLVSDNLEASSRTLRSCGAVATSGEAGSWATTVRENQLLRVGMHGMRLRLMELERECSDMREDIQKLGRGGRRAGGARWWASRVQRMLSPKMSLQMCSAHQAGAGAGQQQTSEPHKRVEKLQAKAAKHKKHPSSMDDDDA